ncbi:MAG: hypothetical protein ACE5LV_10665 [Candidatus Aminicenantales bacterium]
MVRCRIVVWALTGLLATQGAAFSAPSSRVEAVLEAFFRTPAPTGSEGLRAEAIQALCPEQARVRRNNLGSLYVSLADGPSRLAVCAGMDEPAYLVSGITPEGYLRLDRAGFHQPGTDRFLLGHTVVVWTRKGPLEGVVSVPSVHILSAQTRKMLQERAVLDLAFLDIGVRSAEEASRRGVRILDPVTLATECVRLARKRWAGGSLGSKACAAALVDVSGRLASSGALGENPVLAWVAQSRFPVRRLRPRAGLGAVRAAREIKAQSALVVDTFPASRRGEPGVSLGLGPVLVGSSEAPSPLKERIHTIASESGVRLQEAVFEDSLLLNGFVASEKEAVGLFLPVLYPGTPSEVVDAGDIEGLVALVAALLREEGR